MYNTSILFTQQKILNFINVNNFCSTLFEHFVSVELVIAMLQHQLLYCIETKNSNNASKWLEYVLKKIVSMEFDLH